MTPSIVFINVVESYKMNSSSKAEVNETQIETESQVESQFS